MSPTKHSELRMRQRGIKEEFVKYAEYFLSPVYENQCYKIFLTKKRLSRRQNCCGKWRKWWKNMPARKYSLILQVHFSLQLIGDQNNDID